jgi:hypothetical protein
MPKIFLFILEFSRLVQSLFQLPSQLRELMFA